MMKIIKTTAAISLLFFSFSSCDQLEDLAQYDLNFSLDETFSATNAEGEFASSTTINALDDGNISANLDNIKTYEIEKVTITIANLVTNTSPSLSNMKLSIGSIEHSISGLPSLAAMETQGEFEVNIDIAGLEAIRELIVAGTDINLTASATVNDGPASFDLAIAISGKVTVGL